MITEPKPKPKPQDWQFDQLRNLHDSVVRDYRSMLALGVQKALKERMRAAVTR